MRPNLSLFLNDFGTEIPAVIFSVGTSRAGCKGLFCCYIHLSPCWISVAEAGPEQCAETPANGHRTSFCLCNLRKQERIHGPDF
jgi:hypothetical protein